MVRALSEQQRGDLHRQLAALERAGVPPLQAYALLDGDPQVRAAAQRTLTRLRQGQSIAVAGGGAGLFSEFEAAVLVAALEGGSPALAHERLGERAAASARRQSQLRARLLLPIFVLGLALFLLPLPALIAGQITAGAYLAASLGRLLLLAALLLLLMHGWRQLASSPALGAVEAWLRVTPIAGDLLLRSATQTFWEQVALLLGSGLPLHSAVEIALPTVRWPALRREYALLLDRLRAGQTLAQAVRELRHPDSAMLSSIVSSGEGSGKLAESLERYARAAGESLQQRIDWLAVLLPRIAYGALLLWLAWRVFAAFSGLLTRSLV